MASISDFPLIFLKLVIVVGLLVIVGTVGLALGLFVEPKVRGCGGGTDSRISLKYIRSLLLRSSLCSWQDTAVSWVRSRGRLLMRSPCTVRSSKSLTFGMNSGDAHGNLVMRIARCLQAWPWSEYSSPLVAILLAGA